MPILHQDCDGDPRAEDPHQPGQQVDRVGQGHGRLLDPERGSVGGEKDESSTGSVHQRAEERSGKPPGEHSPPNPQISVSLQLNKIISSYTNTVNNCKPTARDLCKVEPNFLNGNVHHSRDFKVPKPEAVDSYLAQLSFKHKAKAEFERKNVWTSCIKVAPRTSHGPAVRLKAVALGKTSCPVRLSVQASRILARETVSVLNFLPSREIHPQTTIVEANLGGHPDVRVLEGVYRAQQNGVLRIPVVNLQEMAYMATAGATCLAEICEDKHMTIGTESLVFRDPAEVVQSMSKSKETNKKPLTKEQMENPTFKGVWEDLEMEENELLKEHPDVKKQVKQLIFEYFVFSREAPGTTDLVIRELNPKMLKDLEKQMSDWSDQGVMEPSTSPWVSPLVPVHKKDGTIRWAVDFRRLNSCLEQDSYPLPRIQTLLDRAGGHRVYSALDATAA